MMTCDLQEFFHKFASLLGLQNEGMLGHERDRQKTRAPEQ